MGNVFYQGLSATDHLCCINRQTKKNCNSCAFPKRKNNNFLKMAVFPTYVPIVKKYLV